MKFATHKATNFSISFWKFNFREVQYPLLAFCVGIIVIIITVMSSSFYSRTSGDILGTKESSHMNRSVL